MSAEELDPPELRCFDEFLNDLETVLPHPVCDSRCFEFMLDCLRRIEHQLPPVGCDALDAAIRVHSRHGGWSELEVHRSLCWRAVEEPTRNRERATEVDALRALIFVLYPPGKEDLVDTLSLFVRFANRAEPHYADLEPILRKHFGDCLPAPTG
jgi:hypothetical protein